MVRLLLVKTRVLFRLASGGNEGVFRLILVRNECVQAASGENEVVFRLPLMKTRVV